MDAIFAQSLSFCWIMIIDLELPGVKDTCRNLYALAWCSFWSNCGLTTECRLSLDQAVTSLHFKLLLEMSVKKKKSPPGTPWTTPTSDFKKVGYIKLLGMSLCLTQRCREATLHPLGKTRNYTHPCPLPHLAQLQSVTEPSHLEETGSGFQAVLRWIWPYLANVSQAHGPAQVSSPPKRWFPYF